MKISYVIDNQTHQLADVPYGLTDVPYGLTDDEIAVVEGRV